MSSSKIALDFFQGEDVVEIARDLLGKYIFSNIDNKLAGGIITETEAYGGTTDRAAHSYGGRRTPRTEVMYAQGGVAYVYLCYGLHHMLNFVTNKKDVPEAVLLRAIQPSDGIEEMLKRRHKKVVDKTLTSGPGSVARALGLTKIHNGVALNSDTLWLEDRGTKVKNAEVTTLPRIGIDYAGPDKDRPWRFILNRIS